MRLRRFRFLQPFRTSISLADDERTGPFSAFKQHRKEVVSTKVYCLNMLYTWVVGNTRWGWNTQKVVETGGVHIGVAHLVTNPSKILESAEACCSDPVPSHPNIAPPPRPPPSPVPEAAGASGATWPPAPRCAPGDPSGASGTRSKRKSAAPDVVALASVSAASNHQIIWLWVKTLYPL